MNIIIVGCGKVGYTLAKYLSEEDNSIVIIDKKIDSFNKVLESIDVMVVKGNGLSGKTLNEVAVRTADLVICVTNSDETNILCCLTAKKLGAKHVIARVRDPEYAFELYGLRKDLGLDMIINPEQQSALEMSRLLRFPSATDIETFVGGRVEMICFEILKGDFLVGVELTKLFQKIKIPVLIAAIERNGKVTIPSGNVIFRANDLIRVIGSPASITEFFKYIGMNGLKIKDAMVIGGGMTTYYLGDFLIKHHIKVKIIEIDEEKCKQLSEHFPNCVIINGDGTDEEVLNSENINEAGAVVCLTDRDEENVVIGLYSKQCGANKVIVKINHINLGLVKNLGIGSIICPKNITAYQIIRYVRGLKNSFSYSNIQTMYRVVDSEYGFLEALEFIITNDSKFTDTPIKDLNFKKGSLLACIVRHGTIIIPKGSTVVKVGDNVIALTENENMFKFDDLITVETNLFGGSGK